MALEAWRHAFRVGFAPQLTTIGLLALRHALEHDLPELMQGCTVMPFPLHVNSHLPPEGCCAVTFAGWCGDGLRTVGELEEFFASTVSVAAVALNDPSGPRAVLELVR